MRKLIISGLLILLSGCTTTTNNYYQPTVNSWRGGDAKNLVDRWGMPNTKVTSPKGNSVYVYKTTSYTGNYERSSPSVGVNFSGERPVIVTMPNTSSATSNSGLSMTCITVFTANRQGKIIDSQSQGNSCYGDTNFAHARSNPFTK